MDKKAHLYLDSFLQTLSPKDQQRYQNFDAYYFCLDEINANICAALVLQGEKRATASLLWWYEVEQEPLPEVGHLSVITNWDGIPQCIIETTSVEIKPFNQVTPEFAFEEGEGDKSLENWKKDHWKFFNMECEEIGRDPSQDMPVILEKFKVIFTG
ncbi:MAG: ASCH domain-containing protein [Chloroflexi bacterium]|nr:ASCH domain-containing protein [Chloroflexota bacterium]